MKIKKMITKVGTYTKDGKEIARWQQIGTLFMKDDGTMSMVMDATFNPAGVPEVMRYKGQINISLADDNKAKEETKTQTTANTAAKDVSDDIPF